MSSPRDEPPAAQLMRQRQAALQTATSLLVLERRERKEIDERLHDIEDRFLQLAEQSGEGFWSVELAPTRIAYVSPAIERLFGVPAQHFYDDPQVWVAAIHPDDRTRVLEGVGEFLAAETARFREEYRVVNHDGAVRWVVARGMPRRDEAGATTRMSGVLEDITERRLLEAQRADAERRTSLALEAGQMGTFELDLATNTFARSLRHDQILGHATLQPEWTMQDLLGCIVPEDLVAVRLAFAAALSGDALSVECRIRWPDTSLHWMCVQGRVDRDGRGNPTRVLGIVSDTTERNDAAAELRTARDAAQAANRAKSQFLANISHEIRTPMNGVIGMTDLVLESDLTAEQRENLQFVQSSAAALLAVINDIMDFARIEAGRLALESIAFNPRDIVADTASAMASKAHEKGLTLIVDVGESVPRTLRGDPRRLRQILGNLLGNAVKFTRVGEIALRMRSEPVTSREVVVHVSVSDTGVGIPLDRQQSVFAAFTQADGSSTRSYGGTGLGLTIALQLAQLMGGRLWVESEAGKGSTFHLTVKCGVDERRR